ncbi:WD40 repeat-like protein [Lentinus brumalis]|uniref:WD40 repeat-like protein n=1 Tax=Lentinus brumalis TaxID=2498619 RepID=A0A371CYE8_9APHY|nr:WD40 repeat-like protein [Polyporus brumalis]
MACKWRSAGTSNLAFSPDSHLLALSGPYDLTLFYIPSGEKLRHFSLLIDDDYSDPGMRDMTYFQPRPPPYSLTWAPDGSKIFAGAPCGAVHLRDLKSHHQSTLAGHPVQVSSIIFSPDGRVMVTGGGDKFCLIWEMEQLDTGTYASKLAPPDEAFYEPVMFSPTHGSRFLTKCGDSNVAIWDTSGAYRVVFRPKDSSITHILWTTFSPDGKQVAAAWQDHGGDIVVRIFDSCSGYSLRTIDASVHTAGKGPFGHRHLFWFSSSGSRVAYIDTWNRLRLWDAETGDYVGGDTGYLVYDSIITVLSPDRTVLATATHKALRVRVLDECI